MKGVVLEFILSENSKLYARVVTSCREDTSVTHIGASYIVGPVTVRSTNGRIQVLTADTQKLLFEI